METPKVLIIEDDLIIAMHISSLLENAGFKVKDVLTKGESALSFVDKHSIDVILMDVQLAGKMNGIETALRLNAHHNIPVIFLTANSDATTFNKAKAAFPVGFITKPFKDENLLRTLEIVLNNSSSSTQKSKEGAESNSKLNDRIFVRDKQKMVKLKIEDILYVQAERNYCKITTRLKPYTLSIPLLKFEQRVSSKSFMRIHRSHLINITAIDELDDNYVFINGKALAVSKSYKQTLAHKLTLV